MRPILSTVGSVTGDRCVPDVSCTLGPTALFFPYSFIYLFMDKRSSLTFTNPVVVMENEPACQLAVRCIPVMTALRVFNYYLDYVTKYLVQRLM